MVLRRMTLATTLTVLASGSAHAGEQTLALELAFERLGQLSGGGDVVAALGSLAYQAELGADSPWRVSTNLLWPVGESLSASLGDVGTISNIDAPNGLRVQELWIERDLGRGSSARLGWLAADSELWSTDSGGLFLHSAFGAPAILATNAAAPPIYPSAALGLRIDRHWTAGRWRAVALDGNAGDPADSRGLELDLDEPLLAFELELGPAAPTAARLELSFGWHRSSLEPGGPQRSSAFALGTAEVPLAPTFILFARVGVAEGAERSTSRTAEVGATLELGRGVLGLAAAVLDFHPAGFGTAVHRHHELIIEATHQYRVSDHVTLQPALQRVLTPSREDAAWVVALRTVFTP